MTTATGSPDYVLQIDMWGFNTHETYSIPNEHARAKYNTFKVNGDYFELEVRCKDTKKSCMEKCRNVYFQVGDYVEDPHIRPAGDMLSRYNGVEFSTYDRKRANHKHCTNKNDFSPGW